MALEKSHCDQNRNANALTCCKKQIENIKFFYSNRI